MHKVRKHIVKAIEATMARQAELRAEIEELDILEITEDEAHMRLMCIRAEQQSAEDTLYHLRVALAHIPA